MAQKGRAGAFWVLGIEGRNWAGIALSSPSSFFVSDDLPGLLPSLHRTSRAWLWGQVTYTAADARTTLAQLRLNSTPDPDWLGSASDFINNCDSNRKCRWSGCGPMPRTDSQVKKCNVVKCRGDRHWSAMVWEDVIGEDWEVKWDESLPFIIAQSGPAEYFTGLLVHARRSLVVNRGPVNVPKIIRRQSHTLALEVPHCKNNVEEIGFMMLK